jgi:DNA-binding response OmpR family regulator
MTATRDISSILIVEDEVSLRGALRDKFTREGFLVHEARDGEEGLAVALAERPHVILLDMMMPKMDGMTMLTQLRAANEWATSVPVFVLTNLGEDDKLTMREILDDSFAHYLVKSNWSIDQIVVKVREAIAQAT